MDRMLRDKKIIALFITPVLIIFSCLIPIPLILSLALGFFRWNLLDLPRFVGLDNFIRLFTMDDIFLQSIKKHPAICFVHCCDADSYCCHFRCNADARQTGLKNCLLT